MLKKLRTKFICFTMIMAFIMLSIIFGMVYGFTARNLRQENLQLMHAVAGRPDQPVNQQMATPVSYLVLQKNHGGQWTVHGSNYYDLSDRDFLKDLVLQASKSEEPDGILWEYNLRYLRLDKPVQKYVFLDITTGRIALTNLIRNCFLIGILSLVLFFGISLLLARWAISPVEAVWEHQKQFVADASHDLKTPLAVILTNAELLSDPAYSAEERQAFSQNILTMAHQVISLVDSMLELARLEGLSPEPKPLDLSALTERVLLPFEPVLFENALTLDSHIAPGLWVKGNPSHLQRLMEIFLDNARKYAAPGPVRVSLTKMGYQALLQVETRGKPLTQEESKQIFRRFYRADSSRKRDGSYGLGLSIAQTITWQHNGRIWAEGTETGNRFSVMLPLCHREMPGPPQ